MNLTLLQHEFIDDAVTFARDKLNPFLKRQLNKGATGSPVPRGFMPWPKVKFTALRDKILELYENETDFKLFWKNNRVILKEWAVKTYLPKTR